jgi:hypothetical protein
VRLVTSPNPVVARLINFIFFNVYQAGIVVRGLPRFPGAFPSETKSRGATYFAKQLKATGLYTAINCHMALLYLFNLLSSADSISDEKTLTKAGVTVSGTINFISGEAW